MAVVSVGGKGKPNISGTGRKVKITFEPDVIFDIRLTNPAQSKYRQAFSPLAASQVMALTQTPASSEVAADLNAIKCGAAGYCHKSNH